MEKSLEEDILEKGGGRAGVDTVAVKGPGGRSLILREWHVARMFWGGVHVDDDDDDDGVVVD